MDEKEKLEVVIKDLEDSLKAAKESLDVIGKVSPIFTPIQNQDESYCINSLGQTRRGWAYLPYSFSCLAKIGNFYRTEEEADKASEKFIVNSLLEAFAREHKYNNPDMWLKGNVSLCVRDGKVSFIHVAYDYSDACCVFPSLDVAFEAADFVGRDRIIKAWKQ